MKPSDSILIETLVKRIETLEKKLAKAEDMNTTYDQAIFDIHTSLYDSTFSKENTLKIIQKAQNRLD